MNLTDTRLPPEPDLDIHPDAVCKQPDLAVRIAYIVATWADIEARLDGIFLSLTGDESALREFRDLKGWDKRAKFFVAHVKASQGIDAGLELKAILATVATPAKKRNEIAHGIWALCKGLDNALVLLPQTAYLDIATDAKKAETAGSTEIKLEHGIEKAARAVTVSHLDQLIAELHESRDLIHAFMIETMPSIVHVHLREQVAPAAAHPEVAARVKNAKASVAKRQRSLGGQN